MELLSGYPLDSTLLDFFIYLFEQENEAMLWEVWVNKDIDLSFADFKKKSMKKTARTKKMSQKEEVRAIETAERILQIREFEEVGEK